MNVLLILGNTLVYGALIFTINRGALDGVHALVKVLMKFTNGFIEWLQFGSH